MSNTVDKRVVEMRFDNNQFEDKANESLQTLSRLKDALNMDQTTKNVSFDNISAGIQALQDRFSTWGIVTMRVIENVTDSMIRLVTNGINFVEDAIVSGGLRRAQNIENAHFQLQALLKDEAKVQQYMDDAMDSVDGTAYAYDEAAKAAAQFAASGIEAGDQVSTALRGITGVAAMTNSDYESISRIFTTIAGNGRLMGDQLLQLSSRGMNAAATIADYFQQVQGQSKITEATVREMVSDGEISFDTFAAAMNWAFGDQAKRANETFSGAFANMKAAFARIGAGFFSPLIEQNSDLVLLLNSLRVRINDVKAALVFDEQKSAMSGLVEATGLAEEEVKSLFDTIDARGAVSFDELTELSTHGIDAVNDLKDYINGVQDGTIRASYATKTAIQEMTGGLEVTSEDIQRFTEEGKISFSLFTSAMETAHGNLRTLTYQFTNWVLDWTKKISKAIDEADLSGPLQAFDNLVETVKSGFRILYSLIAPIGRAFAQSLSIFDKTEYNIVNATGAIKTFIKSLQPSEKAISNIHDLFKGVFDVIAALAKGFIALFKAIVPISGPISDVSSRLSDMGGAIGRALSSFAAWLLESEKVSAIYNALANVIEVVCGWIRTGIGLIGEFINYVKSMKIVQDIIDGISSVVNKLGNYFTTVKDNFSPFKSVFDFFGSIARTVGPVIIGIFNGIGKALGAIASGFKSVMGVGDGGDLSDILNVGFFAYVISMFDTWVGRLSQGLSNVTKLPMSINNILIQVKNTLLEFQGAIKADIIQKIAIAVGILAGSMLVLSMIDSGKLASSLGVMSGILLEVFELMKSLNKLQGSKNPFAALTSILDSFAQNATIKAVATSVLMLAGSLYLIAQIDTDKLASAFAVVSGLLFEMGALIVALSNPALTKVKAGMKSIIALAAAVYILASAVKKLSSLSWEEVVKGLAAVGGLMTEIGLFMFASNKFGKFGTSSGVGLILLAAAIKILEGPIQDFSKMSLEELAKGIGSLAVALAAISGAMRLMPQKGAFKSGAAMILLAAAIKILEGPIQDFSKMSLEEIAKGLGTLAGALLAISVAFKLIPEKGSFSGAVSILLAVAAVNLLEDAILSFSTLNWEQVAKALVTLYGALLELVVAANLMNEAKSGAAAMLIMAAAVRVLAPAITQLGDMSWEQIAKGLVALAGAFTVMGVAGIVLKELVPTILALSGAMTLFGVGVAALGAGLTLLASMSTVAAASIAASLSIIVVSILDLIITSATKIGEAVLAVILSVCSVIGEGLPQIAETIFALIASVITTLAEHAPEIVTQLVQLIVGIIDSLAENIPTLIQSIVNFASELFSAILEVLDGLSPDVLEKALLGLGFISVVMVAMAGLSSIATTAMAGAVKVGLFVGELALLLAAIGALNQIPGLQWLINEGGSLLQSVGSAIGQFIGGIVGGIASGISAELPQVGTDLSTFMSNAQVFIDGAKGIDETMMTGVKTLAGTLLELAAADLVNTIVTKLGGGGIANFGETLTSFGQAMVEYSAIVSGGAIDSEAITASATAGQALNELNESIPKTGGWVQDVLGEHDMADFGLKIVAFGTALTAYNAIVSTAELDSEAITASAEAGQALADLQNSIPKSGGWWQNIAGSKDIGDFGEKINTFGSAIMSYAALVDGFTYSDDGPTSSVISCAEGLRSLAESVKESDPGDTLTDFGDDLEGFGKNIKELYDKISSIDAPTFSGIVTTLGEIVDLASTVSSFDTDGIDSFSSSLSSLASSGITSFCQAFEDSNTQVRGSIGRFLDSVSQAIATSDRAFYDKGRSSASEYIEGFSKKSSDIKPAINKVTDSIINVLKSAQLEFRNAGKDAIDKYLREFQNQYTFAKTTGSRFVQNVLSGFLEEVNNFRQRGIEAASTYIQGISSCLYSAQNAGSSLSYNAISGLSRNINSSRSYGNNFAVAFIQGIQGYLSLAYNAAYNIGRSAVNGLRKGIDAHSPSKESQESANDFGVGFVANMLKWLVKVGDAAEQLGSEAVIGLNAAISKIPDILSDGVDFNPTIRPIVDLTSARESVQTLNGMFNKSIEVAADMASVTGSAVNVSRVRTVSGDSTQGVEGDKQTSAQPLTIQNTFNITSNNPEEVASTVSRHIQRQVERKEATWAQLSGMRSPLVRSR